MIRSLLRGAVVVLGFLLFVGMALWFSALALRSVEDLAGDRVAAFAVLVSAAAVGAVGGAGGVLWELAATTPKERLRRHAHGEAVSIAVLLVGIAFWIGWGALPALLRVAAAAGAAGFMLGFLGAFVPNRRRALEIRTMTDERLELLRTLCYGRRLREDSPSGSAMARSVGIDPPSLSHARR